MLATLPTILISGLVALWYSSYYWKRKEKTNTQRQPQINKVLFFPDQATARSLSSTPSRVVPDNSAEEGNLSILIGTLQGAKVSLDVCVFTISCKELADVLINAHHNGLVVRVISDNEQMTVSGSQIEKLRRAGVQVRNDSKSYFMHHKFALVDEEILASGSLNWTLQGVCGNQENVIITAAPEMVAPFKRQFEKLWEMYDPEKEEY